MRPSSAITHNRTDIPNISGTSSRTNCCDTINGVIYTESRITTNRLKLFLPPIAPTVIPNRPARPDRTLTANSVALVQPTPSSPLQCWGV